MKLASVHNWNVSVCEAIELQNALRKQLVLCKFGGRFETIAGIDVSFLSRETGLAVVVIMDVRTLSIIELVSFTGTVNLPYIPGLLSFREGPLIVEAMKMIKSNPDVLFFDGQGIAHPRRLGIASHMGLLFQKPSIGIAKNRLYGDYEEPNNMRGVWLPLFSKNSEIVGGVLRTRTNTKPVFVSPGNLLDVQDSIDLTMKVTGKYRIPEPTRRAHILTQQLKVRFDL